MRFKINTSWEDDEEERRLFFASLSYKQRLKHLLDTRKMINFHKEPVRRFDLLICNRAINPPPYL